MRITQELLLKLARDNVQKLLRLHKEVVAVYMTGSILTPEPLLGGTTDIDLVFVHKEQPPVKREIVRISYEVSLDIVHHQQSVYSFHRRLRLNPWLGRALTTHASILHDTDYWLEYIQSGVSAQYNNPENIFGRAQPMAEKARTIWFDLEEPQEYEVHVWFEQYFRAVGLAANALAALNGPALPTRRFLIEFPQRAEALGQPGLYQSLLGLIGADLVSHEHCTTWREAWQSALVAASKARNCPPDLHSARKAYYLQSCDAMLESGSYQAAFWPMLDTWSQAVKVLWEEIPHREAWLAFCEELGFVPDHYKARVASLDAWLDTVELILDNWKNEYGI